MIQQFGLLGRHLTHSWSCDIHEHLGSVPYTLFEKEPEEVLEFLDSTVWSGINVTIPYKTDVIAHADECSPLVRTIGAANTLVKRTDGSIYAENTDVLGFSAALLQFLEKKGIVTELAWHLNRTWLMNSHSVLKSHRVAVCGAGGAARAVLCALKLLGANVLSVSRNPHDVFFGDIPQISYDELIHSYKDTTIVVNTTPKGMYPNCPDTILSKDELSCFANLCAVVDIVYNPLHTGITMQAETLDIPALTGLKMLVYQALFASELFLDTHHDIQRADTITYELLAKKTNIVLIGMPSVGKTTIGKLLARQMNREFIDLDEEFLKQEGICAAQYIQTHSEMEFRRKEEIICSEVCKKTGAVIACGGGIVVRPHNYAYLHQNSFIVLLTRSLDDLSCENRPLSQAQGLEKLWCERKHSYMSWADYTLAIQDFSQADIARIERGFYEYIMKMV